MLRTKKMVSAKTLAPPPLPLQSNSGGPLQLLRRAEVCARTSLSNTSLYRLIAEGSFPAAVALSPRSPRWNAQEIEAWIAARIAARDQGGVA